MGFSLADRIFQESDARLQRMRRSQDPEEIEQYERELGRRDPFENAPKGMGDPSRTIRISRVRHKYPTYGVSSAGARSDFDHTTVRKPALKKDERGETVRAGGRRVRISDREIKIPGMSARRLRKLRGESIDLSRSSLLENACASKKSNKPWRTPGGPKKFAVCASEGGKQKLVRFGDPGLSIKRHRPNRRKNFRARHGCGKRPNTKTKLKAGYWACKTWEKKRTVKDVVESRTLTVISTMSEQQPVPVDPKIRKKAKDHVGYPPPGMIRMSAYPAGKGKGLKGKGTDAEYPDTPEGHKIAKAQAWQFPSKVTKAGSKTYRY